jgi:hypothetical protein
MVIATLCVCLRARRGRGWTTARPTRGVRARFPGAAVTDIVRPAAGIVFMKVAATRGSRSRSSRASGKRSRTLATRFPTAATRAIGVDHVSGGCFGASCTTLTIASPRRSRRSGSGWVRIARSIDSVPVVRLHGAHVAVILEARVHDDVGVRVAVRPPQAHGDHVAGVLAVPTGRESISYIRAYRSFPCSADCRPATLAAFYRRRRTEPLACASADPQHLPQAGANLRVEVARIVERAAGRRSLRTCVRDWALQSGLRRGRRRGAVAAVCGLARRTDGRRAEAGWRPDRRRNGGRCSIAP